MLLLLLFYISLALALPSIEGLLQRDSKDSYVAVLSNFFFHLQSFNNKKIH